MNFLCIIASAYLIFKVKRISRVDFQPRTYTRPESSFAFLNDDTRSRRSRSWWSAALSGTASSQEVSDLKQVFGSTPSEGFAHRNGFNSARSAHSDAGSSRRSAFSSPGDEEGGVSIHALSEPLIIGRVTRSARAGGAGVEARAAEGGEAADL